MEIWNWHKEEIKGWILAAKERVLVCSLKIWLHFELSKRVQSKQSQPIPLKINSLILDGNKSGFTFLTTGSGRAEVAAGLGRLVWFGLVGWGGGRRSAHCFSNTFSLIKCSNKNTGPKSGSRLSARTYSNGAPVPRAGRTKRRDKLSAGALKFGERYPNWELPSERELQAGKLVRPAAWQLCSLSSEQTSR